MSATVASGQNVRIGDLPAPTNHRALLERFTLDGSDALELALSRTCEEVLGGILKIVPPRVLETVLLGGGYGRGEGGVLRSPEGDRPYNDLEFYLLLRGNRWVNHKRYSDALHHLREQLTPAAGVEVELKMLTGSELRASSPSMFYYDLVAGHRRLWGAADWLSDAWHHRAARALPLSEATRLMMNRFSGLLFAREKLRHEPLSAEDADFVGRNLAKAELAFGDAVLTACNQYHWSCWERHRRFEQLAETETMPWMAQVRRHHAEGVRFKLHPSPTLLDATALRAKFTDISALALQVWLWLESRRLNRLFTSARDYALCTLNKCPETHPWRNRLVNANLFGPLPFFMPQSRRHPRERVLNALALLLWESHRPQPEWLVPVQKQLRTSSTEDKVLMERYEALWRRLS